MKRRTLKMFSLLLTAVLLVTGIQMPVSAAEGRTDSKTVKEQPDDTTYPTINGGRHGMYSPEKEMRIKRWENCMQGLM